jgi:hypothetical protein
MIKYSASFDNAQKVVKKEYFDAEDRGKAYRQTHPPAPLS